MIHTILSKVMWVGRTILFVLGTVVMLVLLLGSVATVAEAAKARSLKLGVLNTVTNLTSMAGSVAGSVLRLDNNGTGTALDLEVESGTPPMRVNSETRIDNLNADQVDGLHAGCSTGQLLIDGLCYDSSPQPTTTLGNASDTCKNRGGQLPNTQQLRSIRSEPGIDLGTPPGSGHWSADVQFVESNTGLNDLHGFQVFETGGVRLTDDQQLLPYRCVYQLLTPGG